MSILYVETILTDISADLPDFLQQEAPQAAQPVPDVSMTQSAVGDGSNESEQHMYQDVADTSVIQTGEESNGAIHSEEAVGVALVPKLELDYDTWEAAEDGEKASHEFLFVHNSSSQDQGDAIGDCSSTEEATRGSCYFTDFAEDIPIRESKVDLENIQTELNIRRLGFMPRSTTALSNGTTLSMLLA